MNDAFGSPQSVLVLGGGSEIARATVRALAARRCRTVVLAGRNADGAGPLRDAAAEARAAGATTVETAEWDATAVADHQRVLGELFERHRDFDLVLLAVGVLGDQATDEVDPAAAAAVIEANFTGPAAAALVVAGHLRTQGHGVLVVLSSVAGELVRRDNFVYGAAKAGLDGFAQGLDDALGEPRDGAPSGARVMIVRPGFVRTRMTAGLAPAPLATDPDAVAAAIVGGLGRRARIVWVPSTLRPLMTVLRHLPRPVLRRVAQRARPAS